ncbi:MAG: GGDEF domain-containing protein [Alphaproteobacteria bacterium]|nr:MAG: GGDEF domain-containing protein [Alphaproteobacteria bacterium]
MGSRWTKMAQHILLAADTAGARQYRIGQQSLDARYELRSSRLVLAGIVGIIVLAGIFLVGSIYAVQGIDNRAISAERDRAMIAVGLLQQAGVAMDSVSAQKLGRDYVLQGAHLSPPANVEPDETFVPLAGTALVLAWTPRRLGSETAVSVAPMRVAASVGILAAVIFIMFRLYRLARDLEVRRRDARDQATRDPLTALVNRRGFSEALDAAFAAGTPMSLLYIDLDRFKQVNDRYGHAIGDELLTCVAQRLGHLAGPDDCVARLGGDEFVLLRRGPASQDELGELAGRIHQRISLPYGLGEVEAEIQIAVERA